MVLRRIYTDTVFIISIIISKYFEGPYNPGEQKIDPRLKILQCNLSNIMLAFLYKQDKSHPLVRIAYLKVTEY